MSSLVTTGPVSRLLLCRACLQKHGGAATEWVDSLPGVRAPTRRQYAAKVIKPVQRSPKPPQRRPPPPPPEPSLSRAPRLSARSIPQAAPEPARLLFSGGEVPLLREWVSSLENLGRGGDLTAVQCMEGARRYVSVATKHESQWRGQLERKHDLSPYKLHWIGILLISGNTAARWKLGTHMLRSASELGYTPSTLTLVRIFHSMSAELFKQAARSELFLAADARFKEIAREAADPDALTLRGIILAKDGDAKRALSAFRRATKAWKTNQKGGSANSAVPAGGDQHSGKETRASEAVPPHANDRSADAGGAAGAAGQQEYVLPVPREPRWEWEVSCVLGQADILRGQGAVGEAEGLYRVAALELDHPRAFLQLAMMMGGPRDSQERRTYLLKAATSGEPEACRELGELEKMAAAQQGLSSKERAERDMISKEWLRLARGEGLAAVKAGIIDGSGGE